MSTRRASNGFTLIEVLVSLVIVSLLMLVASLGLSLFLDNWSKDRMSQRRDFPDLIHTVLFKNAIEGTYDYYVRRSEDEATYVPYFLTTRDGFAFVTASPLFGKGEMAAGRVRFQQNQAGLYTLVYEESTLDNKYLYAFEEPSTYDRSIPIYDHIRSYSLHYFGPRSILTVGFYPGAQELLTLKGAPDSDVYDWYSDYNGNRRYVLPKQLKMELTFDDGESRMLLFQIRTWSMDKFHLFNKEHNEGE